MLFEECTGLIPTGEGIGCVIAQVKDYHRELRTHQSDTNDKTSLESSFHSFSLMTGRDKCVTKESKVAAIIPPIGKMLILPSSTNALVK